MKIEGTFSIQDWQESIQKQFDDGSKLSSAEIKQNYSGQIDGHSEVYYLMDYNTNGDACFCGIEYLYGTINDKECRLKLKHDGQFKNGVASSKFVVVNATPIKSLIGKTGHFESTESGQAGYFIS